MNAYLSSTTFWGTPANLLGAAPTASGEWGNGGASILCVLAAVLIVFCVAARALWGSVEGRRERKRKLKLDRLRPVGVGDAKSERAERRRRAETRRVALRCAAFWAVVAAGVLSALPLATQAPSKGGERDGGANAAANDAAKVAEKDVANAAANDVWDEPSVEIRAVADAEGSRWENATALQDAESKRIKPVEQGAQNKQTAQDELAAQNKQTAQDELAAQNKQIAQDELAAQDEQAAQAERIVQAKRAAQNSANGKNGEGEAAGLTATFPLNAAEETRLIGARRAGFDSESVGQEGKGGQNASTKARWVQTANGQLIAVEPIRAESSLEIAADSPQNSAYWATKSSDAQTSRTGAERETSDSNRGNASKNVAPTAANVRVSTENVAWRRRSSGQTAAQGVQPSQFAQSTQNLTAAQGVQPSQFAQPTQNLTAAQGVQPSQFAQPTQNLTAARDPLVAAAYSEPRGRATGTALAQEFAPSEPLIPYPSEERVAAIASVSFEQRVEEPTSLLEQIDAEFQRIGERVQRSVLSIETVKRAKTKTTKNSVETGCGFLFQYNDKIYLATNMHVVKDATLNKNVKIFLPDGKAIHPTKIMTCADFDLAALELDPAKLPTDGSVALCFFGNSDELRVSNFVGTVGNPFGLRDTVTYGHVSSLQRRKNDFTNEGDKSLLEFIQIDASINPGNSGGPLYNARGEVVGVVAAIATTTGKSEGVAFAIPINLALNVLKSTIDGGGWSRSHMGVELESATRADFQGADWPIKSGSKIVGVNANSPAERAGLRRGDVVVEFDGEAIEDEVHLARLIAITDVSREANVKFLRGARLLETSARLERPTVK